MLNCLCKQFVTCTWEVIMQRLAFVMYYPNLKCRISQLFCASPELRLTLIRLSPICGAYYTGFFLLFGTNLKLQELIFLFVCFVFLFRNFSSQYLLMVSSEKMDRMYSRCVQFIWLALCVLLQKSEANSNNCTQKKDNKLPPSK